MYSCLRLLMVIFSGWLLSGHALATEPYRMLEVTLLQPEAVFSERVVGGADRASDMIKRMNEAMALGLETYSSPVPRGGFIVIAVRPEYGSRIWLDFEPALPAPLVERLKATARSVVPFEAQGGVVVFAIKVILWEGMSPDHTIPRPEEWLALVRARKGSFEAGQLAELTWEED